MNQPIGIFDSGLGGLTVLRELSKKFPGESFCYLGDIARLPYGNKSPETIRRYGLQILDFLKQQNVKAMIIACNSASTVFLGEDSYQGTPLLNVIGPGAEAALKINKDGKIAVLGTAATIRSHAYRDTIQQLVPGTHVVEQACPLLVPLVEEGFIQDSITELILQRYLAQIMQEKIKTIILGCTHYPVLKEDFRKVLGEDVTLVESGQVLSERLSCMFKAGVLEQSTSEERKIQVCITDLTDHFERLALQLMHPEVFSLEKVVL
ncbi:MAG TPA: glutamate racemase [Bacteriovoracaceae bacterium]|nr:glutamate racemase [Bacteriovoracaceae bacterium]